MYTSAQEKLNQFVTKNINSKTPENNYLIFCDIPQRALVYVRKRYKIDLSNYKCVIDKAHVQHTMNRHEPNSNDRTPITTSDFLLIPYILSEFDSIELGDRNKRKLQTLLFKKRLAGDFFYVSVQEIRPGRMKLALDSLYKRKS